MENNRIASHILLTISQIKPHIINNTIYIQNSIANIGHMLHLDIAHPLIGYYCNSYSIGYMLQTGHLMLHTEPTRDTIFIDIFLRDKYFNLSELVDTIKNIFESNEVEWSIVPR